MDYQADHIQAGYDNFPLGIRLDSLFIKESDYLFDRSSSVIQLSIDGLAL